MLHLACASVVAAGADADADARCRCRCIRYGYLVRSSMITEMQLPRRNLEARQRKKT